MKYKVFIRTAGIPSAPDEIKELEIESKHNTPPTFLNVPINLNGQELGTFTFKFSNLADGIPYYTYVKRRKKTYEGIQRDRLQEDDSDFHEV